MASKQVESFVVQREDEFWINAVIGAVVTVLTSFVPVSPIIGGGVAGYLQRGGRRSGAKVGAASAVIAALPVFALVTLLFGGIGFTAAAGGSAAGAAVVWAFLLFAVLVAAAVMAGMGALGGYLGAAVQERDGPEDEFPGRRDESENDSDTADGDGAVVETH